MAAARGLAIAVLLACAPPASAAVTPTGDAGTLGSAMVADAATLTGTSFQSMPAHPFDTAVKPSALVDQPLAGFPTAGSTFAVLTNGDPSDLTGPYFDLESFNYTADGGPPVRGDTDRDVTILKLDVNAPSAGCLTFDFKFLTEEYPGYVGRQYNDAFIAEIDSSTWTTSGSAINSPGNVAFGPSGEVISVNATGNTSVSSGAASGTIFNGATAVLRAGAPVGAGPHSLFLSIFDQGDGYFDSAVFVDNVVVRPDTGGGCQQGAIPVDAIPAPAPPAPAPGTTQTPSSNSTPPRNRTRTPGASVTQPRGSCATAPPSICIDAPADIKRLGCTRRGSFSHRFGVKMKKSRAGLFLNRISRVTIVKFSLDKRANSSDRKRPYYAFVDGSRIGPGKHVLRADIRLKIPKFIQKRFPGRFQKTKFRRKLQFPFDACRT